jgi:hypothetical protein
MERIDLDTWAAQALRYWLEHIKRNVALEYARLARELQ